MIYEVPHLDCEGMHFDLKRLFEFRYQADSWWSSRGSLNGFPGGVTVCGRFDAPSWTESSCGSDSKPFVCVQRTKDGDTTDDYCAESEDKCPIMAFDAFESNDPALEQYKPEQKYQI